MSHVLLIVKRPYDSHPTYNSVIDEIKDKFGKEVKLLDKNVLLIDLIEYHHVFTYVVEKCRESNLSYCFTLSEEPLKFVSKEFKRA
jgi:hypothetical protein